MLYIKKMAGTLDNNEVTELAFRRIIAEIWVFDSEVDPNQSMESFFAAMKSYIDAKKWKEGYAPAFLRFGESRWVFFGTNGNRISYDSGGIAMEFAPGLPAHSERTIELLLEVAKSPANA